jgi:methionyl aminopeptidase
MIIRDVEELELIKKSADLVGKTLGEISKILKPGIIASEIDKIAEEFIRDNGGIPAFKNYNGYPSTLCISINDVVVHGIPKNQVIKEGDIVSIDCGAFLNGYCGDYAYTFMIEPVDEKIRKLLITTYEALYKGIEQAVVGNRIGDIGFAIQLYVERNGFSVVRELVGHGIGKTMHEYPQIPNYGKKGKGYLLEDGMVICIEPMINMGKKEVIFGNDGWTVLTKDHKPSAHFEHMIWINQKKPVILSTYNYIDEKWKVK